MKIKTKRVYYKIKINGLCGECATLYYNTLKEAKIAFEALKSMYDILDDQDQIQEMALYIIEESK